MKQSSTLSWVLVLVLTLLVSLVLTTLLFTLGLILIEFLLYPLALGISALVTGLTAVWSSNRLVRDGQQALLTAVVQRSEGTAVLLALLLIVAAALDWLALPPIIISSAAALILAGVATYAAHQHRGAEPEKIPTRRVVTWLLAAFLAIPLVIFLASLFGWAGA